MEELPPLHKTNVNQQQTAQKHPFIKLWNIFFIPKSDGNRFHLTLFYCQAVSEVFLLTDFINTKA